MSKAQFNLKHKEVLDNFLLENELVQSGKMFGHPAYYVGGKLFASLYMEGVCIKLPEARVKELLTKDDYFPFQPMGRTMKEWIMITHKKLQGLPQRQNSLQRIITIRYITDKKVNLKIV